MTACFVLTLTGEWQTEPWDPPGAKDGKVPRTERGNVDLHGAALPPPGCVHVNLPRIARVARDMGVDYAVGAFLFIISKRAIRLTSCFVYSSRRV